MKRALPVYLIIDSSGSMNGEGIQAVNNGIKRLIRELRKDPQALELAKLCIIEFSTTAEVHTPLTDLPNVTEPTFTANGLTSLGESLDLLGKCIKEDVTVGNARQEVKGDFKPLVFLMTDGEPSDDWKTALNRFDLHSVNFIVCCAVPGAKKDVLEEISGDPKYVFELDSATEEEISTFFEFATKTIVQASTVIPATGGATITPNSLPDFPTPANQETEIF